MVRPESNLRAVPPTVRSVLRSIAAGFDETRWSVRRLSEGRQARLFGVRARDEGLTFGRDCDSEEFVVKTYRPERPEHRRAARDEFESLYRLHARLDGITLHGWRIRCPRPIYMDDESGSLVMTYVPGRALSGQLVGRDRPPPELLDSIARAVVAALRLYWAGEPKTYGDLILNNVLCDVPARTLALVDPGMPERYYACESVPRSWYPASRDMGFLLFWAASLVRHSMAHPVLHAREKAMVERIVRTFLHGLGSVAERDAAATEIEECARLHLRRMTMSCTPRGLWRGVVRGVATASIQRMLHHVRSGLPSVPAEGDRG